LNEINETRQGEIMSKIGDLERLAALKEKGILTQQEFDAQKKEILSSGGKTPPGKKSQAESAAGEKKEAAREKERIKKEEEKRRMDEAIKAGRARHDAIVKEVRNELAAKAGQKGPLGKAVDAASLGIIGLWAANKFKS
jgi:hypothetical protein